MYKSDEEVWSELPDSIKQNLGDLKVLFPFLKFEERLEWLKFLRRIPALSEIDTAQLVRLIYSPPQGGTT